MSIERPLDSISEQWFALRVKSRCEKVVSTIAHNKGFEEFSAALPVPPAVVRPLEIG